MRFMLFLCAGVASWAGPLMAPVDHSTRVKALKGVSKFETPDRQYYSFCYDPDSTDGAFFLNVDGKKLGPKDHPLCKDLQDRQDSLTIDDVFQALNSLPPGNRGSCYLLRTRYDHTAPLSSRFVERVLLTGHNEKGSPLFYHHALSAISMPRLKELLPGPCPIVDLPAAFKEVEVSTYQTFLSTQDSYILSFRSGVPRLMCRGLDEKGWYAIQHDAHHDTYVLKDFGACLGAGCFAPANNPLKIMDVKPFGIQGISWFKDLEHKGARGKNPQGQDVAPCDEGKACDAVPGARSHIADVRPEIADFGTWLNTVTRAVKVILSRAWILPEAAEGRLAASLQQRLENATQAEKETHQDTLTALGRAVPALAPVVMLLQEEGEDPSPLTIPYMPAEMWRKIFDFLGPQDQAHTIVAYPPLFQHLAFLTSVFPELRTHLPHRIPLALGGDKVVTHIGANYVDILDASPWNLHRIRTLKNNKSLETLSLPYDPLALPSLMLDRLHSHPLPPVKIAAKITFEAKRRTGEHEGDPTTVMDAFLTLTHTQSGADTKIGPLTLIEPRLLKSLLPDVWISTPIIRSWLALCFPILRLLSLKKRPKKPGQPLFIVKSREAKPPALDVRRVTPPNLWITNQLSFHQRKVVLVGIFHKLPVMGGK
ncbi:hypothetical protein [Candidatus Hepatobacter penaei]|uniref:hypothetical protein n=1 Tax=Candidatus Hepatobacter penaei TaxID=1274402 RepID=UPI0004F26C20|nr:hypothetical protein [Candidatus Hepatobacter penaei]